VSGALRGPGGAAQAPPDWLSATRLPLDTIPAGATLVRIHRRTHEPVFYSPGPGTRPVGRFDSAARTFGVLYLATSFEGAFAETILRNPARRLVSLGEISGRSVAVLGASRAVRLVRLHGPGLQALGLDNSISTGPYDACGLWADALFDHADRPDGIAYASRHDPEQICVALFERADLSLTPASESEPLRDIMSDVAAALRRYGKGLEL
jgi:hypothetical protein